MAQRKYWRPCIGSGTMFSTQRMLRRVVLAAGLLILVSCAQQERLSSTQVMEQAAAAAQKLESVRFTMDATYTGNSPLGDTSKSRIRGEGWTRPEQGQIQLSTRIDAQTSGHPVSLDMDVIVAGPTETFLIVRSFSSLDPSSPFSSPFVSLVLNRWFKLPADPQAPAAVPITPDPHVLSLQTEAVRVTKEHSMEEINGQMSYHYDLALDQEKMLQYLRKSAEQRKEAFDDAEWQRIFEHLQMTGSVWIDAQTFRINRLTWNANSSDEDHPWNGTLDASFSDYNNAPNVAPPTGAEEFPSLQDLMQGAMPSGNALPPGMAIPEEQRKMLESLMKGS